jgi:hypothetical protein
VLEALNVAPERVREQVVRWVGSDEAGMGDRRPLTPRTTRRVLEVALEEALRLGHDHGDLGQSFWGRVGEPEGVAAQVLYRLGVDPDGIQREVALVLCTRETGVGGAGRAVDLPRAPTFPARAEGLVVRARREVADEDLALAQVLRVDLDYPTRSGRGTISVVPWIRRRSSRG